MLGVRKFVLEDGERELRRDRVSTIGTGNKLIPAELVVTNHRVIVVSAMAGAAPSKLLEGLLVVLVRFVRNASNTGWILHQIRRDALADAEATSTSTLVVRSKGEGYGMTWFEVTTISAAELASKLHDWIVRVPD